MTAILPIPFFLQPLVVQPFSYESLGAELPGTSAANPSNNVWPAANRAIYLPFSLGSPATLRKVWSANGSVAAGNTDIGVFASTDGKPSTLLVSTGSVGQTGTDTMQIFDTTDVTLPAGVLLYYAMAHSEGTGRFYRLSIPIVTIQTMFGVCQASTAFPLASNPTIAAMATAYIPMFGLVFDTSAVL